MRAKPVAGCLLAMVIGLGACDPASVAVTTATDAERDWMQASAALWSAKDAEFKLAVGVAQKIGRDHAGFALCNVELTEASHAPWAPGARVSADVYVGRADSPCGSNHYWSVLDAESGEVGRVVTSGGEE